MKITKEKKKSQLLRTRSFLKTLALHSVVHLWLYTFLFPSSGCLGEFFVCCFRISDCQHRTFLSAGLFRQHQTRLRLVGRRVQPLVCVPELLPFRGGKLLTSAFLEHEHRERERKKKTTTKKECQPGISLRNRWNKIIKMPGRAACHNKKPSSICCTRVETWNADLWSHPQSHSEKAGWLVRKKSKNLLNCFKF